MPTTRLADCLIDVAIPSPKLLVEKAVSPSGIIHAARTMVDDAQKKIYVLDGNVPILVNRSTMEETLDVEAKSHVEMFHHYFFTLAPDDKYRHIAIKYIDFLLCIINHCSCSPDASKRNDHASNEKQGTEDKHKLDFVL